MKHKAVALAIVSAIAVLVLFAWSIFLPGASDAQSWRWQGRSECSAGGPWYWCPTRPGAPVPSHLESLSYTGFQLPALPAWPIWEHLDVCPGGEWMASATTSGAQLFSLTASNVPLRQSSRQFSSVTEPGWEYPGLGENKFLETSVACTSTPSGLRVASLGSTGVTVHDLEPPHYQWTTRWQDQNPDLARDFRGGHWFAGELWTAVGSGATFGVWRYSDNGTGTRAIQRAVSVLDGYEDLLAVGDFNGWTVYRLPSLAMVAQGLGSSFSIAVWQDGATYLATQDTQRIRFYLIPEEPPGAAVPAFASVPATTTSPLLRWNDHVGLYAASGGPSPSTPWEQALYNVSGDPPAVTDITPGELLDYTQTLNTNFATPRGIACGLTGTKLRCYDSHWLVITPYNLGEPPPCGGDPNGTHCDGFETGNTDRWTKETP